MKKWLLVIFSILIIPGKALAQGRTVQTDFGAFHNISEFITGLFSWAIPLVGALAFLMFIYAGYLYITSQGDQGKIKIAKDIIIGVIAGIILLFSIRLLLQNILGTI